MQHDQSTYYLPKETERQLQQLADQCQNMGLRLDKYAPRNVIEDSRQKGTNKSEWLNKIAQGNVLDAQLAASAYERWLNMTTALQARRFHATTDWRIVPGLGGETVLETDLALHHVYGIPFIPGSALKGLTRAYISKEIDEYKSPTIEEDVPTIKRIFGSQDSTGTVIFFDAMPQEGKCAFKLDIMNSHYPEYYAQNKAPANNQDPNPVTFLTITSTTFVFALAPRDPDQTQHQDDVILVQTWLQEALETYGVGGKTSAGYGYFTINSSPSQSAPAPQQPVGERIRPNIPHFRVGQELQGSVIKPTEELLRRAPANAYAFLSYASFSMDDVLIVVTTEEARSWTPGNTRNCLFVHEEVIDNCTVLVCQPRTGKNDKKKKGS